MYFEMMLTDLCSASCYVQGDITPFPLLQFHHQPIGVAVNKTNDMHYIYLTHATIGFRDFIRTLSQIFELKEIASA